MNSVPALPYHIRHPTAFAIMFGAVMLGLAIPTPLRIFGWTATTVNLH